MATAEKKKFSNVQWADKMHATQKKKICILYTSRGKKFFLHEKDKTNCPSPYPFLKSHMVHPYVPLNVHDGREKKKTECQERKTIGTGTIGV